jgi:DNA-directed RNA polymerase subunit K
MAEKMKESLESQDFNKYEKARVIGARALQISMGAPFLIKLDEDGLKKLRYNPIEIAKLEFEKDVIPIAIKRETAHTEEKKS